MRLIRVRVQARASQEKVVKLSDAEYRIYTRKPAVNGKANSAVVKMLASYLGIRRRNVAIVRGERSRNKIVGINGA